MDIPNLANQTPIVKPSSKPFSIPVVMLIIFVGLLSGYGLSQFFPKLNTVKFNSDGKSSTNSALSTDNISSGDQLIVGKIYGNQEKTFKDTASGIIEKGNINGEGTHILNREGGASQRASLISSAVDLDLFVGKKVEVKGETNASNKTSWLLDVGNIKILE